MRGSNGMAFPRSRASAARVAEDRRALLATRPRGFLEVVGEHAHEELLYTLLVHVL